MSQASGFRPTLVLALACMANVGAAAPTAPAPAASSPGAAVSDACPAQLPVRQTITEPLAGWTAMNQQGNYPFMRVAFYPGPPTDVSLIVPSIEYRGTAGLHDMWDLPQRAGGYWMTCAYANTTATVSRKLADDADFCLADYDGRFATLVVRHWSCGVKRTLQRPASVRALTRPVKPPSRHAG